MAYLSKKDNELLKLVCVNINSLLDKKRTSTITRNLAKELKINRGIIFYLQKQNAQIKLSIYVAHQICCYCDVSLSSLFLTDFSQSTRRKIKNNDINLILFCNNIKNLRNNFGYKQTEVSEKTGISRSLIASIEVKAIYPSLLNAWKLSRIFNIVLDDLFIKQF